MISYEDGDRPAEMSFHLAIAAIGYESRSRWIVEEYDVAGDVSIGLEFGFLQEGAYVDNRKFFEGRSFQIINGLREDTPAFIAKAINTAGLDAGVVRVFVDISSMSREMIANVILGIELASPDRVIRVTVAYAPSRFSGAYSSAPIRSAEPITPGLAGWSTRPEQPLGAVFGLGCEPDLALGALQFLEPDKVWVFSPIGADPQFDAEVKKANKHIDDIFDTSISEYEVLNPVVTRGRLEALLNAVDTSFRVIVVPFGPKVFTWLAVSTVILAGRRSIGVWSFSSKENAAPVDRFADGSVVWYNFTLRCKDSSVYL